MIDRAIIGVAVATLLAILAVALLLLILPLFERLEFDMLCQDYVRRMDDRGGLSANQVDSLKRQLTDRGYKVDRVAATAGAPFGGDLTLTVEVSRPHRQVSPDLTMKEVILSFRFERTVISRKIITAAGEP